MTRLKRFLKNSVKSVILLKISFSLILTVCGCTSSTAPAFSKENIAEAIRDISEKEYALEVTVKLVGSTLWVYLPVEDLFAPADKPEKYIERFNIETDKNKEEFAGETLRLQYLIKEIPEQEKSQQVKYNQEALDKISKVWRVLRRAVFSSRRGKWHEPQFYCILAADVKNGIEMREIFYVEDLKKVSYEFISWTEYQHRAISDMRLAPELIGDRGGVNVAYRDITMRDFLLSQIRHRVKLRFQKPEAKKGVDIDKEVLKIVAFTIKTYDFRDFSELELDNLATNNKTVLNRAALWAKSSEERF